MRMIPLAVAGMVAAVVVVMVRGEQPAADPLADLVLERFQVARNGDALLVPVRIGGQERLFTVDTGASRTVIDTTLLHGPALRSEGIITPGGSTEMKLFSPPEMLVGRLPFGPVESVMGLDLGPPLREGTGYAIFGALGMDFLSRHTIRIDFDRGELLFLKAVGSDAGDRIPITWEPGEFPVVRARIEGWGEEAFGIDTGNITQNGAMLNKRTYGLLAGIGMLRSVGWGLNGSVDGVLRYNLGVAKGVAVGNFTVGDPVFSEGNVNLLGLDFWSRFTVTLDFPQRSLYLRARPSIQRPARWERGGLSLCRQGNQTRVEAVGEGGRAAQAGVKVGDVLLRLGDLRADAASLFELRRPLCSTGRVPCTVRRDGKELELTLDLGP